MTSEEIVIDDDAIEQLSDELGKRLQASRRLITTAESCTGGLLSGAITSVAGSSAWFERGFVTYSNEAKQALLAVDAHVFDAHGAVSECCVRAMAAGALHNAGADIAISVSGIAGPGGASPGKPVGTVWIGWAIRPVEQTNNDKKNTAADADVKIAAEVFTFAGDRRLIRQQAVFQALRGTISRMDNAGSLKL